MKNFLPLIALLSLTTISSAQQKSTWTPPPAAELEGLIQSDPDQATKAIRGSWGKKSLTGKAFFLENNTALWARQHPTPVSLKRKDGTLIAEFTQLDDKGLQAFAKTYENGSSFDYQLWADGKPLPNGGGTLKVEHYEPDPNSLRQEGVPQGKVTRHRFDQSEVFPETHREYEVYIPAQYDGKEPAALVVFQDGLRHADPENASGLRATIVYDNLIAQGKMPVTVGIFVNPGRNADQKEGSKPSNRSFEYDSLGDAYARFLIEELIPTVVAEHDLNLTDDPAMRAIAGGSSGAAAAWTAAWERPEYFGKVLGWVGTFVDIRGANAYQAIIRKTDRKPIRAALLGETNDLDNKFGNWPLANQQMEKSLAYKDYDYKYWWGEGFHGSKHAGKMLPEMLEWLWSDVVGE